MNEVFAYKLRKVKFTNEWNVPAVFLLLNAPERDAKRRGGAIISDSFT